MCPGGSGSSTFAMEEQTDGNRMEMDAWDGCKNRRDQSWMMGWIRDEAKGDIQVSMDRKSNQTCDR